MSHYSLDDALLRLQIVVLFMVVFSIPSVFTVAIHRFCFKPARFLLAATLWLISLALVPHSQFSPIRMHPDEGTLPLLWQAFPYMELRVLPIWFRAVMWLYIVVEAYAAFHIRDDDQTSFQTNPGLTKVRRWINKVRQKS